MAVLTHWKTIQIGQANADIDVRWLRFAGGLNRPGI